MNEKGADKEFQFQGRRIDLKAKKPIPRVLFAPGHVLYSVP